MRGPRVAKHDPDTLGPGVNDALDIGPAKRRGLCSCGYAGGIAFAPSGRGLLWQHRGWSYLSVPDSAPEVDLTLTDVNALSVDVARAGLAPPAVSTVHVTTDGPSSLTLTATKCDRSWLRKDCC